MPQLRCAIPLRRRQVLSGLWPDRCRVPSALVGSSCRASTDAGCADSASGSAIGAVSTRPDYGQQGQGQPPTYSPPPAYGHPPAPALDYTQPQGYGSAPGYGYGPAHARHNSTPIFVGLGLIALVAVIIAGALLLSSAGGPHATSAPSAIARATPTAGATPTPTPIPTPTPTPTPTSAPTSAPTQALPPSTN